MKSAKTKIQVAKETLDKVLALMAKGPMYHIGCVNLGCLTFYFARTNQACPRCSMGFGRYLRPDGADAEKPTPLQESDFEVAEPEPLREITLDEIKLEPRASNQLSILMTLPGYWRPIKVESFGYIGFQVDNDEVQALFREYEKGGFRERLEDWEDSGFLARVLADFGYKLRAE